MWRLLLAVYLSELTKFELIITIVEHNCGYLAQLSDLMCFHIKCSAKC